MNHAELKSLVHYNPDTGIFTHTKARPNVKAGTVAGSVYNGGYIRIGVGGTVYLAHRLAWFYVYGEWPNQELDHINRIRTDNRISNLRQANTAENCQNRSRRSDNTSGHPGVCWFKKREKWVARIAINQKRMHLGYFDDIDEAISAYEAAKKRLHHFGAREEAN